MLANEKFFPIYSSSCLRFYGLINVSGLIEVDVLYMNTLNYVGKFSSHWCSLSLSLSLFLIHSCLLIIPLSPYTTPLSPDPLLYRYTDPPLKPQIEKWRVLSWPHPDWMLYIYCGFTPTGPYAGLLLLCNSIPD